jgi:CRISPR-associated endoribonuclease Cas6
MSVPFDSPLIGLTARRVQFTCVAQTPMELPPVCGSTLRGGLLEALVQQSCPCGGGAGCGSPGFCGICPICPLMANDGASKVAMGTMTPPRPFTIEPPLRAGRLAQPGDTFQFSLTIFGDAIKLLPLLVSAVTRMGQHGIGDRRKAPGRFALSEVWMMDPVGGVQRRILSPHDSVIAMNDLPITHGSVLDYVQKLPQHALGVDLLTPLRLIHEKAVAQRFAFDVFVRRIMRRVDQLTRTTTGAGIDLWFSDLIDQASAVHVTADKTQWVGVQSYSRRTGHATDIGGLVGKVTLEGHLGAFLPWLAWGELSHVGKDATKGNGWYRLCSIPSR